MAKFKVELTLSFTAFGEREDVETMGNRIKEQAVDAVYNHDEWFEADLAISGIRSGHNINEVKNGHKRG